MDISSILPLLMSGGKMDLTTVMSLLSKNGATGDEKASDMANVISTVMKNKPTTPRVTVRDLLGFVGDEILGKITKYMENYQS